jgi:hypothetical protein
MQRRYANANRGEDEHEAQKEQQQASSDASSSATSPTFSLARDHHPLVVCIVASVLFLGAHALFVIGQTETLWEIRLLATTQDLNPCPGLLPKPLQNVTFEKDLLSYSYIKVVQQMWDQPDIHQVEPWANINFDVKAIAKVCAAILVLFSGCWPHVKLLATHVLFYLPASAARRTRALLWLEFFGKWSMLDVFAIVLVITVFSVEFTGPMTEFFAHAVDGFPAYVSTMANRTALSHVLCNGLTNWSEPGNPFWPEPPNGTAAPAPSPGGCHDILVPLLATPGGTQELAGIAEATCALSAQPSGNVSLVLKADTREGVYYFSTAVWASLLLSTVINMRDELVLVGRRRRRLVSLRTPLLEHGSEFADLVLPVASSFKAAATAAGVAAAAGGGAGAPGEDESRRCRTLFGHAGLRWWWNALVVVGGAVSLALLWAVQFLPILARDLVGSTYHAVDWLNNESDSEYHEYTMWDNTASLLAGNGTDAFLQKDLVIFTMVGPVCCVVCAFVSALLPLPLRAHWVVAKLVQLGFTFSGMEVLCFASLLCAWFLPVQSATLTMTDGDIPSLWCLAMDHLYGYGRQPCFYESIRLLLPQFLAVPGFFAVSTLLQWMVHRATRRCYPTDL